MPSPFWFATNVDLKERGIYADTEIDDSFLPFRQRGLIESNPPRYSGYLDK